MNNPRRRRLTWSLALLVGFTAGIFFVISLGSSTTHVHEWDQPPSSQQAIQGRALLNQFSAAFEEAAARINPSVVPIFSESVSKAKNPSGDMFGDEFFRRFFGTPRGFNNQNQTVRSLGSGVIVSKDGYILTNNHVIDGADKLTVQLADKKKYTAKVIGRDPQTDIAVIKISASDLPVASLGNSDSARVGQWVIAVGNPFQLMHTVTAGIISAKGRSQVNLTAYEDYIQTDASINPGNSGGALADLDGNVIGINTAIFSPNGSGNIGIGFAVPINMARNVMNSLIDNGKVARGYLGLVPQDIDENLAKALGLKSTEGVLVGDVSSGAPAEKAGIKRGDILLALNGTKLTSASQLRNMVADRNPGSAAELMVSREGKQVEVKVKLGERPADGTASGSTDDKSTEGEHSAEKLGLTVEPLSSRSADELGYKGEQGVVVTGVTPGSPAEEAGIQRGDLIKEVNRQTISSVNEFNKSLGKSGSGDSMALLVRRGQTTFFVAIQE
jgi:serine protease Do